MLLIINSWSNPIFLQNKEKVITQFIKITLYIIILQDDLTAPLLITYLSCYFIKC